MQKRSTTRENPLDEQPKQILHRTIMTYLWDHLPQLRRDKYDGGIEEYSVSKNGTSGGTPIGDGILLARRSQWQMNYI